LIDRALEDADESWFEGALEDEQLWNLVGAS
jgi:hypothetical protein